MTVLNIPLSYDAEFVTLIEGLQRLGPKLCELDGIGSQLDIHQASQAFFNNSSATTADHSIDANANVSGRDVITYNYEVPKPLMKLNSYYNLWKTLYRAHGHDYADKVIIDQICGDIYINDVWDIGRPYCFNFSTFDIALGGLKMGSRLTIDPPKSLFTFLRQVEQFTVYAGNSTLGATGLADLLIVASCFVEKLKKRNVDNHTFIDYWPSYVAEQFTSLIYTLNWEFRGHQSPFTNVSVYDRNFLAELLPHYVLPGEAPVDMDTVLKVQEIFLMAYNGVLERTPITFPVVTACFSKDEATGEIKDKEFVKTIAKLNAPYGAFNIYMGQTSTLSSCCRLRSSTESLGYSNTFGAGATKIGSLGVVTINLPRLAWYCARHLTPDLFLQALRNYVRCAARINQAKRVFIQKRIDNGSLPLYTLGHMSLSRQYSTCGLTGMAEALGLLGLDITTDEGQDFVQKILEVINETNQQMAELYGTPHNCEQVPAENSAVKLAAKDKVWGVWACHKSPPAFYSNQFIPLTTKADILDRIHLQGKFDHLFSGGAICHLNVGEPLSPEAMEKLIHHCAREGVIYWAANYALNRCADGHISVGHGDYENSPPLCPECGMAVSETFTRVVGFLTSTKNWNKARREHDWPNRQFYTNPEKEVQALTS